MSRTGLKLALLFVGGHVLLGLALLGIEATHGVNDQDASFAVALAFYYPNWPSVCVVKSMGSAAGIGVVLLLGIVQWVGVALVIAVVYHACRAIFRVLTGQGTRSAEAPAPADGEDAAGEP